MGEIAENVVPLRPERSARAMGTDELNICEFPLASIGRAASRGETTLVFEDDIFDQGAQQTVHRKLIVSGTKAFGLPTSADSDLLLILIQLTNLRNGFSERSVEFTRFELLKAAGWDQGGKAYRRIDEGLRRWANVTLNYHQAWWDRDGHRWQSKSFHILESVELNGRAVNDRDVRSNFCWNPVIFASFQANHLKRLDLETYFRLKLPAARQSYRFLDKRFYHARTLEFELRSFACEHVGLSRGYDNGQLKRKLQPAIEELESIGFLKRMSAANRYAKRRPGEWVVKLVREAEEHEPPAPDESDAVVHELTARGVKLASARRIVADFPEDRIREKIRLHDWLLTNGESRRPRNPAGFLAAAIRCDYSLPQELAASQKGEPARKKGKSPKNGQPTDPLCSAHQRMDAARRYLSSLGAKERAELESAAVAKGNRFHVATYRRLKEQGSRLSEEVRDALVADYLESQAAAPRKSSNSEPGTVPAS